MYTETFGNPRSSPASLAEWHGAGRSSPSARRRGRWARHRCHLPAGRRHQGADHPTAAGHCPGAGVPARAAREPRRDDDEQPESGGAGGERFMADGLVPVPVAMAGRGPNCHGTWNRTTLRRRSASGSPILWSTRCSLSMLPLWPTPSMARPPRSMPSPARSRPRPWSSCCSVVMMLGSSRDPRCRRSRSRSRPSPCSVERPGTRRGSRGGDGRDPTALEGIDPGGAVRRDRSRPDRAT